MSAPIDGAPGIEMRRALRLQRLHALRIGVHRRDGFRRAGQGRKSNRRRIATAAAQPGMRPAAGSEDNSEPTAKEPKNRKNQPRPIQSARLVLRLFGSWYCCSLSFHASGAAPPTAAESPPPAPASALLRPRDIGLIAAAVQHQCSRPWESFSWPSTRSTRRRTSSSART